MKTLPLPPVFQYDFHTLHLSALVMIIYQNQPQNQKQVTYSLQKQVTYSLHFMHSQAFFSFHNVNPRMKTPPINCRMVMLSPRTSTETMTATSGSI